MNLQVIESRCPQNHRCPSVLVCPVDALMQKGNEAPVVDEDKCISCGKCVKSTVYKVVEKHCKHLACPVPTVIIKGMEIACGLALPMDVIIYVEKE